MAMGSLFFRWVRNVLFKYAKHCLRFMHKTNMEQESSPNARIFPDKVIAKFFENLSIHDIARMRLVCKQWRSILSRQDTITAAPEPPWLILSEDSYLNPKTFLTEIRFESLTTQITHRFEFPKLQNLGHGGWVCGHSNGWLIIAVGTQKNPVLFLWNPLSGAKHELPPTSTLPFFDWFVDNCRKSGPINNISCLVSRLHVFEVEFSIVVVGIFRNPAGGFADELAFCTVEENNTSWIVFTGEKNQIYDDILFHKQKLHVLAKYGSSPNEPTRPANYTINLTKFQLEIVMLHHVHDDPTEYTSVANPGFGISKSAVKVDRLVESSTIDELLIVTTLFDHCSFLNWHQGPIGSFQCTQTREFQIRRLTMTDDCARLERLNSIGEQAIFLGSTSSFSVPSGVINGESDRIYYATDEAEGLVWEGEVYTYQQEGYCYPHQVHKDEIYVAREQGIFIVDENRIIRTSLKNLMFPSSSVIGWFAPKLF